MKRFWKTALSVLIAIHVALLAAPVHAVTIQRGPLLQNPEDHPDTATLVWWTDVSGDSIVRYGMDPGHQGMVASGGKGLYHEVRLEGLPVDASCYYTVETNGKVLWSDVFRTAPAPQSAKQIVFVVIGDFGTRGKEHFDLIRRIEQLQPDFVVTVGDNAYDEGTRTEIDENWLKPWSLILSRYLVYPTLGNHDVKTHGGKPYLETWALPRNNAHKTEQYYSFNYGMIHCAVLNSNQVRNSSQTQWLEQDLAGSHALWEFAFFHHPPYSCNRLYESEQQVRKKWSPLFERHGVDMVFTGHHHNYQRSSFIDDYTKEGLPGQDGKGTYYIVTGGGGEKLDDVWKCESSAFAKKRYEFVKVTVDQRHAVFEAIETNGNVLDRFELKKS